jgi:hypothetical protein
MKRKRPKLRPMSARRKLQLRLLKKRQRLLLRNLQRHMRVRNKQFKLLPRKLRNHVESVLALKNHLKREIITLPRKRRSQQSKKLFLMEAKLQQRQIIRSKRLPRRPLPMQPRHQALCKQRTAPVNLQAVQTLID